MRFSILFLFLSFFYHQAHAQWHPLGYRGGWPMFGQNENTLFGFVGEGIYISTDDGDTWTNTSEGLPLTAFSSLQFVRFDRGDLHVRDNGAASNLAVHYQPGTYVLPKGERTWTFYNDTAFGNLYGPGVKRLTKDSIFSIVPRTGGTYDSANIVLTTNGGETWETRMPDCPDSMHARCNYVGVYKGVTFAGIYFISKSYSIIDQLWRSTDAGMSWKNSDLPGGYNLYANSQHALFRRVFPPSVDTVDYDGFYRSIDTGQTWQRVEGLPTDGYWNLEFIKDFDDKIFACFQYNSNNVRIFPIYTSVDSGRTWKREMILDSTDWFIDLHKRRASGNGYIATLRDNFRPFVRLDNDFKELGQPSSHSFVGINARLVFAAQGELVALRAGVGDSLYRSITGYNWTASLFHEGDRAAPASWLQGEKYVYTYGQKSSKPTIYRSPDSGKTWIELISFETSTSILNFTNVGDTLFLSLSGLTLYVSKDAGMTWLINSLRHPFKAVEYHDGFLYAQETYPGGRHYAKSPDLGETWEVIQFPFNGDSLVSQLHIYDDIFYAVGYSTTQGKPNYTNYWYFIYASTDQGKTWFRSDEGLPSDAFLYDMYSDKGTLFLFSSSGVERSNSKGRSRVFYSLDKGRSWKQVPGEISEAHAFLFNDKNLYLTSGYGGIFEQSKLLLSAPQTPTVQTFQIHLTPNPGRKKVQVRYTTYSSATHSIEVLNVSGAILQRYSQIPDTKMENSFWLDCSDLPSGPYAVRIANGMDSETSILQIIE